MTIPSPRVARGVCSALGLTACVVMLAGTIGCSTWDLNPTSDKNKDWWRQMAGMPLPPEDIIVVWTPDKTVGRGGAVQRGLGGRVYLHDKKGVAVPGQGELTVNVYVDPEDNRIPTDTSGQPDIQFVFKPSDLESHFSKTALGPSYSIWLPWPEDDLSPAETFRLTLIPVFKPSGFGEKDKKAKVVFGAPSKALLPPSKPLAGAAAANDPRSRPFTEAGAAAERAVPGGIRPVAYDGADDPQTALQTAYQGSSIVKPTEQTIQPVSFRDASGNPAPGDGFSAPGTRLIGAGPTASKPAPFASSTIVIPNAARQSTTRDQYAEAARKVISVESVGSGGSSNTSAASSNTAVPTSTASPTSSESDSPGIRRLPPPTW